MDEPTDGKLLTVKEAAAILRVSPPTLYKFIMTGEIPSFKIRGARRITVRALFLWVEKQVELEQAKLNGKS